MILSSIMVSLRKSTFDTDLKKVDEAVGFIEDVRNRLVTSIDAIRNSVLPLLNGRLDILMKETKSYEEQVQRVSVALESLEQLLKTLDG